MRNYYQSPTKADLKVARRRFHKYIELTKGRDKVPFEEIEPQLPRNGASIMSCGHTRFDHDQGQSCKNAAQGRCGKNLRSGRLCTRRNGHTGRCHFRQP